MVNNLLTGEKKSGIDVEKFMIQHLLQIPNMGIPGIALSEGAKLLLPKFTINYQTGGTIELLKENVNSGYMTLVGVSWQTNNMIINIIEKNLLSDLSDIFHGKIKEIRGLFTGITIGHWMVVVGYDDINQQLIVLNPGRQEDLNTIDYNQFRTNWTKMKNIFIGSGDMITIHK